MEHFHTNIADLNIEIQCHHPYTRQYCKDYITDTQSADMKADVKADRKADRKADISAVVTSEDITSWKERAPEESEEYLESLCVHQKIAERLPFYNRFLFHGAVITFRDQGFIFTAPSGTGKSTHIRLWRHYLGEAVDIVNGDKPIIAIEFGHGEDHDKRENPAGGGCVAVRAYGTPWSGKERWQKNRSTVLRGICFLKQSNSNTIRRLRADECLDMLLRQVFIANDAEAAGRTLELLDQMVTQMPIWLLECDMSEEAVRCSFEALTGLDYEEHRY